MAERIILLDIEEVVHIEYRDDEDWPNFESKLGFPEIRV